MKDPITLGTLEALERQVIAQGILERNQAFAQWVGQALA